MEKQIVFFIDVDNTLLNNDHIKEEIKNSLIKVLGEEEANHFWQHHDSFRQEKKLIDFPNIIREYCQEKHKNTCELTLGRIFQNIEFKHALYPQASDVIKHLKTIGKVVLFTEGDDVYQKMKLEKSGLSELSDGVELYKHKLDHLKEIVGKYKNHKAIFIEDRSDILQKIKKLLPEVFTIEVCQGHYATSDHREHEKLDKTIGSISELLKISKEGL